MTTREDIRRWFNRGVEEGKTHMVVWVDTFDYEDYPVYTNDPMSSIRDNGKNMQRIMEIYDLRLDRETQINTHRVWNV